MAQSPPPSDYSLQSRLVVALSVVLFLFLGIIGVVMDRAFRTSVEAGAAERLQVQVYVLLGAVDEVDEENGQFYFLEDLREPRFGLLNSGLYGFISSVDQGELWRSQSASTLTLSDNAVLRESSGIGETQFSKTSTVNGDELFVLNYGILWEDARSEFSFIIMENTTPYYAEIANFRTNLWSWLGGVACLLLLTQVLLMRWGLAPLHSMARDLKAIESGQKQQLHGSYPKELRGVTDNLNLLIKSERKQQDRYRTTLGDLAHSLKTPLAVISGVMASFSRNKPEQLPEDIEDQINTVDEQLTHMNQIVTYQLQRAVQSNGGGALARQVRVAPAVDKIINALDKVYAAKAMQHDIQMDPDGVFYGDERDLMEVLGNVLDNAYKYGHQRFNVSVTTLAGRLTIKVEDDGPGIDEANREFVLQRGARADTLAQGQGIGLAVVTDIVGSYGGNIKVGSSAIGGARIEIVFNGAVVPAA